MKKITSKAFQQRSFEEFLRELQRTMGNKENAKEIKAEIEKIRKKPPWQSAESKLTEGKAFKKHSVKGKDLTWQAKKEIIDRLTKNKKLSLVVCAKVFTPQEKREMKRKLEISHVQFQRAENKAAAEHAKQMKQATSKLEKNTLNLLKKGKKFGKKLTSLHRF